MKKQVRKIPNVLTEKWISRFIGGLKHQQAKTHHILIISMAVLLAAIVLFIMLPNNNAEAAAQSKNNKLALQSNPVNFNYAADASMPVSIPSSETIPATPVPTIAPTPTPDPTLKQGDENERVQQLQERLMELNYLDLDESTQLYGPATEYGVELFQRQQGLTQDGIAGPATLDQIYSDGAKKYTLLQGTSGSDVDSLQRQLIDLGYLENATGYYGTETVAAVMAFQERNSLSVDGKTGEQTLALIYSPDAKKSATKVQAEVRSANISTFLDVAEAQLGDPYIFGNVGPSSFDCSGLIYYCLTQAGSSLGRYNAAGYSQVGDWEKITSMDNLQKGDVLFFSTNGKKVGHTGIYIGNGEMIDASSSNGKVVKRSCVSSFWQDNFVVARRPF